MFVRPNYAESELLKWIAIASIAAALMLALATAVGAADVRRPVFPPGSLPADISTWSRPMPIDDAAVVDEPELVNDVWRVLALQQELRFAEAINTWEKLTLSPNESVWKQVALGQAYLATGELAQAEDALRLAHAARPQNAVVHYFRGMLCLEQARRAHEWLDRDTFRIRFASSPRSFPVKPKSIYEMEAVAELEAAIAKSADLRLDEPLVPHECAQSAMEPTVQDLLLAIGAANFDGKACKTLATLFLEHGSLEIAEQYMDDAANRGMVVVPCYRDLAEEYQARGQFARATRAYWKSITNNSNHATTAGEFIENLGNALRSLSK